MSEANREIGQDEGLELLRWLQRWCAMNRSGSACSFFPSTKVVKLFLRSLLCPALRRCELVTWLLVRSHLSKEPRRQLSPAISEAKKGEKRGDDQQARLNLSPHFWPHF